MGNIEFKEAIQANLRGNGLDEMAKLKLSLGQIESGET